ncbi:MAG: dihydropteroate synthase [Ignavibacteriae bacterium]|nr:MAG: dihydropteroate synthase [Ignavibacteriota bacterium]
MLIQGIVNVTPDSFSDGGQFGSVQQAVDHALRMIDEGADILDIGGESTRPGSEPVSESEEYERVIPVINGIRAVNANIPISIDTMKSTIARAALDAGATMINDVTAGRYDAALFSVAAEYGVPLILMHMSGEPKTMQVAPVYDDVVQEVKVFLRERVRNAREAGVTRVYVDPGIGFGKTLEHNLDLLRNLDTFAEIAPVVLGISRKRFIGAITGIEDPAERDVPTALIHALLWTKKVEIVRVHDVKQISMLRTLAQLVGNDQSADTSS